MSIGPIYARCSVNANDGKRGHERPPHVSWEHVPRRWRGQVAAALVLACSALWGGVPVAAASSADAHATHAYLLAQYRLITALLRDAHAVRGAESASATQIARECPGVVSGMPQEHSRFPMPPPRVRGENARLAQQEKTIGEELDAAVERPGDSLYRPAKEAWAAEVRRLSWSNPAITSSVQAGITARLETIPPAAPPFCADARAWAQSGYRVLSAASREFEVSRAARTNSEQGEGLLETLLKPYENASDRALISRTNAVEYKFLASVFAAVETILRLKRILGYPRAATQEPKKEIRVGHGRTAVGTRFEVSSGSGGLFGALGSCHRFASVFYSRLGASEELIQGVPNNPICLSSPRYRHPALFCEVGIETIQSAVPASVRSARLLRADGRTIESRVIHVPRRDGGPAGIYAQEIRGSTSHAVSLVELDVHGGVVVTLELPRYHCRKSRHESSTGLPTSKELASGHTPAGEPFAIRAFGTFNGQPALGIDPELSEPLFATKAFSWSLSIGCAPNPYAIFYAILRPPGEAVTARTPQGVVPLNVVPLEPRLRAKGPLVYGVFNALPTELTVLGANGSIVYTENLQAKAAEATQFCEGYAEP
jgi:hypothetical protein